jgi:hypothetical protein
MEDRNFANLPGQRVVDPTIQFELKDVKRVPVMHNAEAYAALCQATQEAVRFPVALSEIFGAHDEDVIIHLSTTPKHLHHVADNEDEMLLDITVTGKEHISGDNFHMFINMSTLEEPRVGRSQGFNAVVASEQVYKHFKYFHKGQSNGTQDNTDNSGSRDNNQE